MPSRMIVAPALAGFCVLLVSLSLSPCLVQASESHGVVLHVLKETTIENLNPGKYRMRAIELAAEAGRILSHSTYPGPSMAYVLEGTVTSSERGQEKRYREDEGAAALDTTDWRYKNDGDHLSKFIIFELVPATEARAPEREADHVMLEREIDIPSTTQKLILVHGTIEPGGFAGEHTHQGAEMRLLLSGSLTMTMHDKTAIFRQGEYFFEPAHTHMMKVEGDRTMFTDFVIFEVGDVRDVDTVYHAGHSAP